MESNQRDADTAEQSPARTSPASMKHASARPSTRPTPLPAPQLREFVYAGRAIPYMLRYSARARNVRLVIRPESGLEVVAPLGTKLARIEQVVREKTRWIETTLARVAGEAALSAPPPLEEGSRLAFAGQWIRLTVRTGAPVGRFRAALHGDTLTLTVADLSQAALRAALEAWYRRQAHAVFLERLAHWNEQYHFVYGRMSVKEQKSRWGSCSRLGNVNFNWRLMLAPLPVLDYVVIHELCHLKEMNHSARFWALVERTCPDYATHRRWLREHGRELHI